MAVDYRIKSAFLVLIFSCSGIASHLFAQSDLQLKGVQMYRDGDFLGAVEVLEDVILLDEMRPEAHLILISSYLQAGDPVNAEIKAVRAYQLFPALKAFDWLRAESLLQQNKTEQALHIYNSLNIILEEGGNLNPLEINQNHVRVRLGQMYQQKAASAKLEGKNEEAINSMAKALDFMSDSIQVYKNMAILYLEEDRIDDMLNVVKNARIRFPGDPDLIRLQASAYYKLEDRDELLKRFEEIHALEPENINDGLIYSELLMANQQSQKSYDVLENLLSVDPNERRIYEMMIKIHENRFSMKGKRLVLNKMRDQFTDKVAITENIAETYILEKNWESAREVYDSLRSTTGDTFKYGLKIAESYEYEDLLDSASHVYKELYEQYSDEPYLLLKMGRNFEKRDQWNEAVEIYQELTEIETGNFEAHTRLGVSIFQNGNADKASEQFKKAIELGSNNPETYLYLSKIEDDTGLNNASLMLAVEAFQKSLENMELKQKKVQGQLQESGLQGQAGIQSDLDEMKRIELLVNESFDWLTKKYSFTSVSEVLEDLLKEYPLSGRLYYMTGAYYSESDYNEKALTFVEEAIRLTPKQMEAHYLLGTLYEERNLINKAIEAYQRANSLGSNSAKTYKSLINVYRNTGDLNSLCDQWLARYRASSSNEILKVHLIEALHKANRFDEARQILSDSR